MKQEILRMEYVTRKNSGNICLDQVNLHIFKGEIMGLIAADYRGKTELVELICRNLPISQGRIYYNNRLVNNSAHSSQDYNRVSVIQQQSSLIQDLSVADNIFVMRRGFKKYIINRRILGMQVERLLKDFNTDIDPGRLILQLTPLERCIVELIKANLAGSGLIVLRDLSNFLSVVDLKKFQVYVRIFCQRGISFLYMANHHQEVFQISDRAALLMRGRICKVFHREDFCDEAIAPYTISFDISASKTTQPGDKSVLELKHVVTDHMNDLTFHVRKGECLVLLDMSNTVIEDLKHIMAAGKVPAAGSVWLEGHPYTEGMSKRFLNHGIAIIEDNPTKTMAFPDMTYLENLTFLVDKKLNKSMIGSHVLKSILKEYEPLIGSGIYANHVDHLPPIALYDMIYYRIHIFNPKIVFCIQPFAWGDMLCRRHVLDLIQALKNKGITVVIAAVNLSDSLDVADRLLVIRDGRLIREYLEKEFEKVTS